MDTSPITEYLRNNLGDVILNVVVTATFFFLPWIWRTFKQGINRPPLTNPFYELRRILLIFFWQLGFFGTYLGVLLGISFVAPENPWGSANNLKVAALTAALNLAWCAYRSGWRIAKIDFPEI
jgi:hypothetical protein